MCNMNGLFFSLCLANGMQIDKLTPDFQSWKRCAQLAVVWNHCEIARHSIFNAENRSHWQVTDIAKY